MNTEVAEATTQTTDDNTVVVANVDDMATDLVNNMPRVEPHVREQLTPQNDESEVQDDDSNEDAPLDDKGNKFDPRVHKEPPEKKKDGTWKKKTGSAAHRRNIEDDGLQDFTEVNDTDPLEVEEEIRVEQQLTTEKLYTCAAVSTSMLIMVGKMFGGEEWAPIQGEQQLGDTVIKRDEVADLNQAFYEYYKARGITEIDPAWGLGLAILGYAAPRFTQPATQSRWQQIKNWFFIKVLKRRNKKIANEQNLNNRQDGPREDGSSEEAGQEV